MASLARKQHCFQGLLTPASPQNGTNCARYEAVRTTIPAKRGTNLGYDSAERAPLIGKRMKEAETIAVFQAMHGSGAYIRIRFGGGAPTLPDPVPDAPRRPTPRRARPAQQPVYDPHAFYPGEEGPEFGA